MDLIWIIYFLYAFLQTSLAIRFFEPEIMDVVWFTIFLTVIAPFVSLFLIADLVYYVAIGRKRGEFVSIMFGSIK